MPSAVTATIYEGISFEGFVWKALEATGYGRIADGRDLKSFKFEVSDFHAKNIKRNQELIDELMALTPEQIEERAEAAFQATHDSWSESRDGQDEKCSQLEDMRKKVLAWKPPTDDHNDFKGMMLSLIDETMEWDFHDSPEPQRQDAQEWYRSRMEVAASSLQNSIKRYQEELKRVKEQNAWLDSLRESVPPPE